MIVRSVEERTRSGRAVSHAEWTSVRLLLAEDGMGFSFHVTTLRAGSEHTFEYRHHFESVYCISGRGLLTDAATGETFGIGPGVMYALDRHDRHTIRAEEDLVMACCFNPPLTGTEVHRSDGSYAPPEEAAAESGEAGSA